MPRAEIIAVGNEILTGEVLDTNSHWLCARLAARGAEMARITVIPDDAQVIAETLRQALARGSRLVITTGGLGPTEDDRTLRGVADALGVELQRNERAYEWVRQTYRRMYERGHVDSPEMTPAREKMACLPDGSEPLPNKVGAAPGVMVRSGPVTIVCLPGVPAELESIFDRSLTPLLEALFGPGVTLTWRVELGSGDETQLAPILKRVSDAHPTVYVKSRARRFGAERRFLVTLSARAEAEEEAQALLEQVHGDLAAAAKEAGIPVLNVQRTV